MAKKKHSKKDAGFIKKQTLEALQFQTHWGLKQIGEDESSLLHKLADEEIEFIRELNIESDILDIKKFIENIKRVFNITPIADSGDFTRSIVTLALGIGRISDMRKIDVPVSWSDQIQKKILAIVFDEEHRNEIVIWAKDNGYNTSTYLGQPIVKFQQLFIKIERMKNDDN